MGIQHSDLPYAAVQFHPESILTSPAHGMTILSNALGNLRYSEEDDGENCPAPAGAVEIIAQLEDLGVSELKERLLAAGLSSTGTKSQLMVRLALWMHKSEEFKAGRLELEGMTVPELRELKQGLGLKGTAPTKSELTDALEACFSG
uniref:SAP domain-containing protein n=1 Tax=Pseudictyota dubia TaxID=2749911 RepID=A0A6U2GV90_9STRA|mmetsp:Transcript_45371/g.83994  ORF Transcript_45371/g.83994 Transcript_45371/m.83994 type:complete len:147 (+) Transcript_45371:518-958(+)